MPLIVYLTALVGSILITLTSMSQAAFWQRKEYRMDRVLSAVFRGDEPPWPFWLELLGLGVVLFGWLFSAYLPSTILQTLGWILLVAALAYHIVRISKRGVVRPELTAKVCLVLLCSIIAVILGAVGSSALVYYGSWWWSTLVLLTPFYVAITVGLVNLPIALRKRQVIAQARRLRNNLSHLLVVGITGSYGKTSTKYFLEQLLINAGYQVKATVEHRNAEFPVAQDMLAQLSKKVSHYIVEMGAYRSGEIAALAALVSPTVGVVTAISNQHAALFGSIKKLAEAKWELIMSLPPTGIAVINQDDLRIMAEARNYQGKLVTYSLQSEATVWLENIQFMPKSVKADLHIEQQTAPITIPVAGKGMLASAVAAIATAHSLGLPLEKIVAGLSRLQSPPRTMSLTQNSTGATVIDDSYSASEGGTLAALEHLEHFTQKNKIIVFSPIIELGSESAAVHRRLGEKMAATGAMVFIYGTAHVRDIRGGISHTIWQQRFTVVINPGVLAQNLKSRARSDSVVLLAGRVPEVVRQSILL